MDWEGFEFYIYVDYFIDKLFYNTIPLLLFYFCLTDTYT